MRALFINPGGIGDQILLLPTVKLLKKRFSDSSIDLITEPRSSCIREITDLYKNIYEFNFKDEKVNILELRSLIKKHNYKYVFCTGSSYKANIIASFGEAEVKIGFKAGVFSKLFLTHAINLNTKQYAANMFAELLSPVIPEVKGLIKERDLIPEIKLSPATINFARETLNLRMKEKHYARKVFIHPGVSKLSVKKNILKSWSAKNWALLIEKLLTNKEIIVVLIGGKDDEETISEIHKNLTFFAKPKNFYDLSKISTSIENLASLINLSELLVCCDSAPMHIGVALNKKIVAMFGPTDPRKLLPNDPRYIALYQEDLHCRPCLFDVRNESCGKPICLEVTPEMMLNKIKEQIS